MVNIPSKAKKIFKGVLHDVYQWQQTLYDGSTKTFEMIKRRPSVYVIATMRQKILVLRQKQPGRDWFPSLPGGWRNVKEDALKAAERELLEETGHESKQWKIIIESNGSPHMYFHEIVFAANDCQKMAEQKLDGGEIIEVSPVSFQQFLQADCGILQCRWN